MLTLADPLLKGIVPNVLAPSRKATSPVGVPAPGATATTVAVNVTDCPNTELVGLLATIVVVESWFTTCAKSAEVLPLLTPSPPYSAVIVWLAVLRFDVLKLAT